MPKYAPDYSWVDLNLEERKGDDFIKQYSEFCKQKGIPFDNQPYLSSYKFAYQPPPENMGLADFTSLACNLDNVAGSLRRLPQLPFETEWTSVSEFKEPCHEYQDAYPTRQEYMPSDRESYQEDQLVSGSVAIPSRRYRENLTETQAAGWADARTLPNAFYIRQGTFDSTLPSRNGAGLPFNGLWNTLSYSYDLNIDVSDVNPELRQKRYQPVDWQATDNDRIGEIFFPDQLQQAANRYTKLVAVSKDPSTGAYMLHYGRDEMIDYKGKVYNTPPTVNLGAPNPLFDRLTNTGNYPNTRGQFMTKKPNTNDMSFAKPPTNGFESVSLRDNLMQNSTRSRLNKRGESLYPIAANANANNPQNTFAAYGNFGMRAMATTGNIVKVLSDDQVAAQPDMSRPSFQYVRLPGQKELYYQDYFQRAQQSYDIGASLGPYASNSKELNVQAQIEGAGMADRATTMDMSRQYSMQSNIRSAQGPIGAEGMAAKDDVLAARTYQMTQQSIRPTIDGAGMASTEQTYGNIMSSNMRAIYTGQVIEGSGYNTTYGVIMGKAHQMGQQVHTHPHLVYSQGFTDTASILAHQAKHNINYHHHAHGRVESSGYTVTSSVQSHKHHNHGMRELHTNNSRVEGQGYIETQQTNAEFLKTNMRYQPGNGQIYAQGMGDTTSVYAGRSYYTTYMAYPTTVQGVDAHGYGDQSVVNIARSYDNTFRANPTQTYGYDASGYASTEQVIGQQARPMASGMGAMYTPTVFGTGYGDYSYSIATAQTYNLNPAGPNYTYYAYQLVHDQMLTELPKMYQQPAQYMDAFLMANEQTGGPKPYKQNIDDGAAYQLQPFAEEFRQQSGVSKALNNAMMSSYREAISSAGVAAFEYMKEKDLAAGRQALVAGNIVGLTATTPSPMSPDSPNLDQYVYGMHK